MTRITELPIDELLNDLEESARDAERCKFMLDAGYARALTGESYKDRMDVNNKIIDKVKTAIKRRVQQ